MLVCIQACSAAVQTTHLLRMLAAVLLAILLRAAKTVIYTGQNIASWQRFLIHLYDVPPVLLLSVVQLSAIGIVARQSKLLPSCIPDKVYGTLKCAIVSHRLHPHSADDCINAINIWRVPLAVLALHTYCIPVC